MAKERFTDYRNDSEVESSYNAEADFEQLGGKKGGITSSGEFKTPGEVAAERQAAQVQEDDHSSRNAE